MGCNYWVGDTMFLQDLAKQQLTTPQKMNILNSPLFSVEPPEGDFDHRFIHLLDTNKNVETCHYAEHLGG